VVEGLRASGAEVVEVSRSRGVDLVSGTGLAEAVSGVDVVVDASNAFPSDEATPWGEALAAATRNVVEACAGQGVSRLVLLSICGIEDPAFDQFEYYLAKREQERIVAGGGVAATIVKTTQWYEFATNPAAVTFHDDRVEVQDWLVQPVAADSVAAALVQEALEPSGAERVLLTGPEQIHLPELTRRRLEALGDSRPVHKTEPYLPELAEGVLLAPAEAQVVGPNVEEWLAALT
jgi:uncharacterized protein YbjT (DUF2867 family)